MVSDESQLTHIFHRPQPFTYPLSARDIFQSVPLVVDETYIEDEPLKTLSWVIKVITCHVNYQWFGHPSVSVDDSSY